ncbi:MAG: pilus assembly protein [Polyangia bacterium]|jgi:hypothetical protein|nr:pilus assembly protein [Polyangia bacterium]
MTDPRRHFPTWCPKGLLGRRRPAQTLTEFAIVAPVLVTILLFSAYFYELIQIKLKTQEVARFAAWEFTGIPLHDYKDGSTDKFSGAKSTITQEVERRYANLKSGDTGTQDKAFAVRWDPPQVRAQDQLEPKIPGGQLANQIFNLATLIMDLWSMQAYTHGNWVLAVMMGLHQIENRNIFGARGSRFNPPKKWGFNTKGYPKVTVSLRYQNMIIPKYFMEGSTGWYKGSGGEVQHFKVSERRFQETVAVVADSWKLHSGEDVDGPKDRNDGSGTAYFKQVDRMAFVSPSVRGFYKGYTTALGFFMELIQLLAMQPPLTMEITETTLVAKAYGRDGSDSAKGTVEINEDDGKNSYDTIPFKPNSEYVKTFEKRGKHFMGCDEPEQLGCFDSTSQNNPFGDFVEPPPETP